MKFRQVVQHQMAEFTNISTGLLDGGNHDGESAGRKCRPHAGFGVFDRQAPGRDDAQSFSGLKKRVRCRFSGGNIIPCHDVFKKADEPGRGEVSVCTRSSLRRLRRQVVYHGL